MGTALRKPAPWIEARFGVAVRTGFRRTDENTGRTVEMFLCPHNRGRAGGVADQSYAFFAEVDGDDRVECSDCSERHPVIDFLEAEKRKLIVTRNPGNAEDGICSSAVDMAKAIRQAARPKKATARR